MARVHCEADERRLESLLREHERLARERPGSYSLRSLFSDEALDIEAYCRDFRPNPHAAASEADVERFARRHGVWVEKGGDHYNSMTAYLHPTPDEQRLTIIGKSYAVMFFMNDTIGREKLGHMSAAQKQEVRGVVGRIDKLLETGTLPPGAGRLEEAARESLEEIRQSSPPAWFGRCMAVFKEHIAQSFHDKNARAQAKVPTVDEYIESRLHVAGMYVTIEFMELGDDQFIPWAEVAELGLTAQIRRLQWLCAAIGALMNDVFSFEKEFVAEGSDFNLVPVIAMNAAESGLHHALTEAARMVRAYVVEFRDLAAVLEARRKQLATDHPALASALAAHIRSLTGSVHATWAWQSVTDRYRSPVTIFEELRA